MLRRTFFQSLSALFAVVPFKFRLVDPKTRDCIFDRGVPHEIAVPLESQFPITYFSWLREFMKFDESTALSWIESGIENGSIQPSRYKNRSNGYLLRCSLKRISVDPRTMWAGPTYDPKLGVYVRVDYPVDEVRT